MSSSDDQAPYRPNIPVTLKSGNQEVKAKTLIKEPTEGETRLFSSQQVRTCGGCRFMQKDDKTDRQIRNSDIGRRLAHEYGWKPQYMPGKLKDMGICRQKNDTLVGVVSRACEYYKPK